MNDNLNTEQFRFHQGEPGVGYHVADPAHRESIQKYGLRPGPSIRSFDQPGGTFVFHDLHGPTVYAKQGDLWKIDTKGLEERMQPDRMMAHWDIKASHLPHAISPKRLRLAGERTEEGVVLRDP